MVDKEKWPSTGLGSPHASKAIKIIRGHVHMTSAQGGGEGGNQKEDENGQGGRGGSGQFGCHIFGLD